MTAIYLAGPIDHVGCGGPIGWADEALAYLAGACVYMPQRAFGGTPTADPGALTQINLLALSQCDAILAAVWPEVPSWGTPTEIEVARQNGQPVILWVPDGARPAYLCQYPSATSLQEACERALVLASGVAERECPVPPLRDCLCTVNRAISAPQLPEDAGYDLRAMGSVSLEPGEFRRIPMGGEEALRIAVPTGHWACVIARSSWTSRGLLVPPTVIEQYRGPIYTFAFNASSARLHIGAGERVAQLVLFPLITPALCVVADLPGSERGSRGFGSTGD